MTKKRLCKNCKHLEHDGMFGIFCGVGGNNTNYDCSKYEQKRNDRMTGKRFSHNGVCIVDHLKKDLIYIDGKEDLLELAEYVDKLQEENEQLKQKVDFYKYFQKDVRELEKKNEYLKKGMIGVVDRYIKNVECNPPSSLRTYGKIKGALNNIREDLRSLIGDVE